MKLKLFSPRPARLFRHLAHFEAVLGTSLEIQVVSSLKSGGAQAEAAILSEIDRLDAILSAYNPRSELSRWQNTFDKEVAVSAELAGLLYEAERWKIRSHGAFNPAVEALTRFWQRAESQNLPACPLELADLAAQMDSPGWQVDVERGLARRLTTLPITLNCLAKGFIVDRAALVAAELEGVEQVVINVGGDIRHIGAQKMPVSVADPRADAENAPPIARVAISGQGIATSGNYRRCFHIENRHFSHLIDPRTGWPVETVVSASVIAPSAMMADVTATIFSVVAPAEALQMADECEVGAFLVDEKGAQFCNSRWQKQVLGP